MIKNTFIKKNSKKKKINFITKDIKKENSRNIYNTLVNFKLEKKILLKKGEFPIKGILDSHLQKNTIRFKKILLNIKKIHKKFHFKYSYDFFSKINSSLIYSKKLFSSVFILTKVNLKGLFELNLNFNCIKKVIFRNTVNFKQYSSKKKLFKNFLRSFLKISKKLTLKNFSQLNILKNTIRKRIAFNKNFALLLNKILLKNRQRINSVLNYGFFFTFLLKSNNISELNYLFSNKAIFNKNVLFLRFYNINLFKNYFFRNDFIGINNRYFFIHNDISHYYSEIFNIIFANISVYNSYTKLNNINIRAIV